MKRNMLPNLSALSNRLYPTLEVGARKRKGPSLDRQKAWIATVTSAWQELMSYYRAAVLSDQTPADGGLEKVFDDLDAKLEEIREGIYDGTLEAPKISSLGEAMQFVLDQITDPEQKKQLRYGRSDMQEADFFD